MSSVDVEDKGLGTRMTGTYQVLDQGQQQDFGTAFSPTSPKAGDTMETNNLGDLAPPRSGSPECLLPENGLNQNEHVLGNTEPSPIEHVPEKMENGPSMLLLLIY